MELVSLTLAPNEPAAEAIRGLLANEGIESLRRLTDFGAGTMDGLVGQQEVLVAPSDLDRARALIGEP